jgi:hypothetical protein
MRAFELCIARECIMELKGALHGQTPPSALALSLPSGSGTGTWLIHEGIPDVILFPRADTSATQNPTLSALKLGLAASRGKCVAAWQRDAAPQPAAPELQVLGLAEAIAAGATEIDSRPVDGDASPGRAWRGFADDLRRRGGATQPAARIAVMCSVWTGVWQPEAQHLAELGARLCEAGLPFDFVCDDDIGPQLLPQYPLLIVPDATCLSDATVEALQGYGRCGGGIAFSGRPGACTEHGAPRNGVPRLRSVMLVRCPARLEELAAANLRSTILDLPLPMVRLPDAAPGLAISVLREERSGALQVHLVNRDPRRPVADAHVMLPTGLYSGWQATLMSPGHEPRPLEMRKRGGQLELTVPEVRAWETILIERD